MEMKTNVASDNSCTRDRERGDGIERHVITLSDKAIDNFEHPKRFFKRSHKTFTQLQVCFVEGREIWNFLCAELVMIHSPYAPNGNPISTSVLMK